MKRRGRVWARYQRWVTQERVQQATGAPAPGATARPPEARYSGVRLRQIRAEKGVGARPAAMGPGMG
jgi:hypothetical protein